MVARLFLGGRFMATPTVRRATLLLVAATLLAVAGCRKVSGTYEASESGATVSLNFKSSDKVDMSMKGGPMTSSVESSYAVDGDTVKIHVPPGQNGNDLLL